SVTSFDCAKAVDANAAATSTARSFFMNPPVGWLWGMRLWRASPCVNCIAARPPYLRGNGSAATGWYRGPMTTIQPVGTLLREWRQRRRPPQMALALDADISSRHLSFVETGRAQPSREMLLHLSEELEIPLRERNTLLVAGGYAPMFRERRLDDA